MGIKNIAISDEAYERLRMLKKPGESFTDVIARLTQKGELLELAGVLSKNEGVELKRRVKEVGERSSRHVLETAERLS